MPCFWDTQYKWTLIKTFFWKWMSKVPFIVKACLDKPYQVTMLLYSLQSAYLDKLYQVTILLHSLKSACLNKLYQVTTLPHSLHSACLDKLYQVTTLLHSLQSNKALALANYSKSPHCLTVYKVTKRLPRQTIASHHIASRFIKRLPRQTVSSHHIASQFTKRFRTLK